MDATRALLDSLMGKDRNAAPDSKRQSFKDPDVCKYHLVGDCPHEMWVNQGGKASPNSPVGPCKKQHSEAMRERLKDDKDYVKYRWRYLEDLRVFLQKLVDDNNKKAQKVREKLNEGVTCTADTHKAVEGHLAARETLANEKLQAAEKMAEEGNLEVSKQALEEADKLAHQKFRLTRLKEVAEAWMDECCDVCGSQISWRAVEELEARSKGREHPHVPGSWHQGWKKCREALKKVTEEAQQAKEALGGVDVGEVVDQEDPQAGRNGRRAPFQVRSAKELARSRSRDASKARKRSPSKEKAQKERKKKSRRSSSSSSRSRSKRKKSGKRRADRSPSRKRKKRKSSSSS
ncbi:unnamed protein product [Durusdinium trenchii]|uniref:Uncharacterized protein n=1 Tax=Durusdinium trenchii TaxID=1381693 RepID=A0ABP0J986_9DINO